MKYMLVTGGAGFIGSNFIHYILKRNPDVELVNLDALTYAGNPENLSGVDSNPRYLFVRGDIRDRELVDSLFRRFHFDTVVNFAAESHVDRSIDEPDLFLSTNVIGTQTLLEAAKCAWKIHRSDNLNREFLPGVRFLQISTDEVYGTLGATGKFTESSPIAPNSPYSASKAGADMIVRAYCETYGLPVNITRCSNNYGPCQHPEKLIPKMIGNILADRPLTVYGDGEHIRDWLYVEDHCSAINAVLERGKIGEVYNIGGNCEMTNLDMIRLLLQALGRDESLIVHVGDRPGHDRRYALDCSKIRNELAWNPAFDFDCGIQKTIQWYLSNNHYLL